MTAHNQEVETSMCQPKDEQWAEAMVSVARFLEGAGTHESLMGNDRALRVALSTAVLLREQEREWRLNRVTPDQQRAYRARKRG
jgi:hypothetical protein